eukprot:5918777-Amphidinium_carterae.1
MVAVTWELMQKGSGKVPPQPFEMHKSHMAPKPFPICVLCGVVLSFVLVAPLYGKGTMGGEGKGASVSTIR